MNLRLANLPINGPLLDRAALCQRVHIRIETVHSRQIGKSPTFSILISREDSYTPTAAHLTWSDCSVALAIRLRYVKGEFSRELRIRAVGSN